MGTFSYPQNAELTAVGQVITPTLTRDDILFDIMPIITQDSDVVMWEQMDDYFGLQQIRGVNGEPPKVQPIGQKSYIVQPGVYGEHTDIDEKMLKQRRRLGSFNEAISLDDLILQKQNQLLSREIDRIRYIGWTLLLTGTFSVSHPNGAVVHTDTFSLGTYDATTWATVATATPLADFRAVQLLGPAQGTDFNGNSYAIMNRVTSNTLLANTNAADLGGKRTSGLSNMLSIADINKLNADEGLPQIVIYDKGYKNDSNTWTRFIPNGKVAVIGQRPANAPLANYVMTRNVNNEGMAPGSYSKVEDTFDTNQVPRYIRVHQGHDGGPAIYFPGSIIIMDVS